MNGAINFFLIATSLCRFASPLIAVQHDPHAWLEEMESDAVWEWTEKQNRKTDRYLIGPRRLPVEKRVKELAAFEEMALPVKNVYTFLHPSCKQAVLKRGDKILVDPNVLSEDGTVSISGFEVDREGAKLAYGLSDGGTNLQSWHFINLETGEALDDVIEGIRFNFPQWSVDGRGVYYIKFTTDTRQGLFYHQLGSGEEKLLCDPAEEGQLLLDGHVVLNGNYFLLSNRNSLERKNGLILVNLETYEQLTVFHPGMASYQFIGEKDGGIFLVKDQKSVIRINPLRGSEPVTVIKGGSDNLIEAALIGDCLICHYMKDAVSKLQVFNLQGLFLYGIGLPGIGSLSLSSDPSKLLYGYIDFCTPLTIFQHDFENMSSICLFKPNVCWESSDIITKQIFVERANGPPLPLFITHKKGIEPKEAPTLLTGYGGFNIPLPPNFNLLTMAWLDSGGVYVSANLRGGGEYGPDWYDAGRHKNKQNVFDDFISAAEWLIESGITTREKLAITGRSNGGLLVGAALVQRPDLFAAAVPQVGVLDMLNFHRFTIGWCWKSDYGDPEDPSDREYLLSYSPCHNVQKGVCYPPTLITTSDRDDCVVPMHSYKFAAALQDAQGGENPILLRVYRDTGHRHGRSTLQLAQEVTDIMTFLLQTGS